MPLRLLAMLWASPYTLLGLLLGIIGLCTGGRARRRGRVIEFHSGGVKWLLQQFFFGEGALNPICSGRSLAAGDARRTCVAALDVVAAGIESSPR